MDLDVRAYRLVPFRAEHGPRILGWVRTREDLINWCGRDDHPLTDATVFARWQADPDVRSFVLLHGDDACGYGETWVDAGEREVELARILVAPDLRGRGAGKRLTALLLDEARRAGFPDIWVRVAPGNLAALACYRAVGFARAPAEKEAELNRPQPRAYVWMRLETP